VAPEDAASERRIRINPYSSLQTFVDDHWVNIFADRSGAISRVPSGASK
jgi:hypothetical protein